MHTPGRRIHEGHHAKPYFHVSIDAPDLVASVLAAATLVWHAVFGRGALGATASLAYVATGLVYLFTHYLVRPRGGGGSCTVVLLYCCTARHRVHCTPAGGLCVAGEGRGRVDVWGGGGGWWS
jgi:hypothetical protein